MKFNWIPSESLLQDSLTRTLYHEGAAALPVPDFHCHLDPADLAADRHYSSRAELWVTTDPYKHRAMRFERKSTSMSWAPCCLHKSWEQKLPGREAGSSAVPDFDFFNNLHQACCMVSNPYKHL